MSNLQTVIVTLSVSYAVIGALLLLVLVYARLPWPVKAAAVVVTSAFYVASFTGARGLLGWASVDRLPQRFKLLQARVVDPHTVEGDPGAVYLWVEALDDDNRPSGVPGLIAFPTATRSPTRRSTPPTRSPPATRKAAAPAISAPARAASSTPRGNTSCREPSSKPPAAIPRPANSRPASRPATASPSRRCCRRGCRRRMSSD